MPAQVRGVTLIGTRTHPNDFLAERLRSGFHILPWKQSAEPGQHNPQSAVYVELRREAHSLGDFMSWELLVESEREQQLVMGVERAHSGMQSLATLGRVRCDFRIGYRTVLHAR